MIKKSERMDKDKITKNWDRLMEVARKTPSPFKGMTKQQVIKELRKTREQLWKKRIANLRHK